MTTSRASLPSTLIVHEWVIKSQEVKSDDGYIHTFFRSNKFPERTRKKNKWRSTLEMVAEATGNGQFSYRFLLKTTGDERPTLQLVKYTASICARNTYDNTLLKEIASFNETMRNSGNAMAFQGVFAANHILSYFDGTKDSPDLMIKVAITEVKKQPGNATVQSARKLITNSTTPTASAQFSSNPANELYDDLVFKEPYINLLPAEFRNTTKGDEITSIVNDIETESRRSKTLNNSPMEDNEQIKPIHMKSKYQDFVTVVEDDDDFQDEFGIINKANPRKRSKAGLKEDEMIHQAIEISDIGTRADRNTNPPREDNIISMYPRRRIRDYIIEETEPHLNHNNAHMLERPTPTMADCGKTPSRFQKLSYNATTSRAHSHTNQSKDLFVNAIHHSASLPSKGDILKNQDLGRSETNLGASGLRKSLFRSEAGSMSRKKDPRNYYDLESRKQLPHTRIIGEITENEPARKFNHNDNVKQDQFFLRQQRSTKEIFNQASHNTKSPEFERADRDREGSNFQEEEIVENSYLRSEIDQDFPVRPRQLGSVFLAQNRSSGPFRGETTQDHSLSPTEYNYSRYPTTGHDDDNRNVMRTITEDRASRTISSGATRHENDDNFSERDYTNLSQRSDETDAKYGRFFESAWKDDSIIRDSTFLRSKDGVYEKQSRSPQRDEIRLGQKGRFKSQVSNDELMQNRTFRRASLNDDANEEHLPVIQKPIDQFFRSRVSKPSEWENDRIVNRSNDGQSVEFVSKRHFTSNSTPLQSGRDGRHLSSTRKQDDYPNKLTLLGPASNETMDRNHPIDTRSRDNFIRPHSFRESNTVYVEKPLYVGQRSSHDGSDRTDRNIPDH